LEELYIWRRHEVTVGRTGAIGVRIGYRLSGRLFFFTTTTTRYYALHATNAARIYGASPRMSKGTFFGKATACQGHRFAVHDGLR
jgi:hypothetical protein